MIRLATPYHFAIARHSAVVVFHASAKQHRPLVDTIVEQLSRYPGAFGVWITPGMNPDIREVRIQYGPMSWAFAVRGPAEWPPEAEHGLKAALDL
jgi:hypothetical protein